MRETGSTIEIKVKTDTSSFSSEMNRVKGELEQVNQATERMSRGASKTSGMYKILAKEISGALNQFRATGDIEKAEVAFAGIRSRIDGFGSSLDATSPQMQEYYTLLNKNAQAVGILNSEYASSTGITRETAVAQRTLAEETKRSADVLKARAKAVKFDADLQKRANQEVRNSIEGVIAELRGLSVKGTASAEQVSRLFLRTANTAEDLTVTTNDLTQAFVRQAQALQASEVPYKNKQKLLNQITIAEHQSAQSIRVVNRGLAQQGQGVGDVSYAMMSFTRLLEDVPYGFRGFANNIQPTVFGLVQMNEKTEAAAAAFRKLHGKDMPLAQRAMLNLKTAFSGPINQLLLLTSVIAVAGTMIERYSQQSNKAKQATKELGNEFLRLYDVAKGDNPLETDYTQSIKGLEDYAQALDNVANEAIDTFVKLNIFKGAIGPVAQSVAEFFVSGLKEQAALATKNLDTASGLSKEAKDRLKTLQTEAEVQLFILKNEEIRAATQRQINERRVQTANDEIFKTQDLIDIERVRQARGEEAAIRQQSLLKTQRIQNDANLDADQKEVLLKEEQLKLDLELLRLAGKKTNESKKQADQFFSIAQSLARQLDDTGKMYSVDRLITDEYRELLDLEKQIDDIRASGGTVTPQQAEQARLDITQRYSILIADAEKASQRTVKNLTQQFLITNKTLQAEQARILGNERLGTQLEFEAMELEFQLDLREKLNGLTEEDFKDAGDKATAEAIITKELQAQYRMRLLTRSAQARSVVDSFLGGKESDEAAVQRSKQDALLANEEDFLNRRMDIQTRYASSVMTLNARMESLRILELERAKAIELQAQTEINAIKIKTVTEGAMMIVGALSQLNDASDVKNRQDFESQKRFSASLATINTLLAITQVFADKDMGTALKFASASAMAIAGFAQVKQILATKYGGASTGGFSAPNAPSQGFIESDAEARGGVSGTVINTQPQITVNVTGKVDREGIAFMVNDGFDQIGSRGVVLQ
jgi:hypothetical protein